MESVAKTMKKRNETSSAITCEECEKWMFLRKKSWNIHYVLENVIWTICLSREIHKTSSTIPCTEKRSEYYTCNECEDDVNCKGHLTKSQEAECFLQNFMCFNMHRMQETFILKKKTRNILWLKCGECQTRYFSTKSYTTHFVL